MLFGSHCYLSFFSFFISSLIPLPVFEDRAWGQMRNWSNWEYPAFVLTACCARASEQFADNSFTSIPFPPLTCCSSIPSPSPTSSSPPLVLSSLSCHFLSIYSFHCKQLQETAMHPKASSNKQFFVFFFLKKSASVCSLFSEKGACKAPSHMMD